MTCAGAVVQTCGAEGGKGFERGGRAAGGRFAAEGRSVSLQKPHDREAPQATTPKRVAVQF